MNKVIRLGTRGSALARWQTDHVCALLCAAYADLECEVVIITTQGDRQIDTPLPQMGGKGVFTAELEAALHNGQIDLAVHSLKDLPTDAPTGLTIGAVPRRADPHDMLISRSGKVLEDLPPGAVIGTSSTRRAAQIRYVRPDLEILDLRGNVDTRVRKALDPHGPYDAIVLAAAGLERLGIVDIPSQRLRFDLMLPAPGQGALAVQCRDDAEMIALLAPLNHAETLAAVTAERAFLAVLGSGCAVPVAAYASLDNPNVLTLHGRVCAPDGTVQINVSGDKVGFNLLAAKVLGTELAEHALSKGAYLFLSKE